MHETLGDGNFAVVKRCVKVDSGEEFAVKIIDKKKLKVGPTCVCHLC